MLDYFVSENILGQVSIQLEMTNHDWSRLKASAAWMQVEQILMESEKQNSHCFRHNQTNKPESRQEVKTVNELFVPHELKTIEVDTEKKIFRINGEDFGHGCTGFMITCTPDDFRIDMEIDTTVRFVSYSGKGKLREQGEYESKIPLVQSHRLP